MTYNEPYVWLVKIICVSIHTLFCPSINAGFKADIKYLNLEVKFRMEDVETQGDTLYM